ncbi:MAG: EamA family transporter, partial [Verrucomicrobiota bacterium]
TVYAYSAYVELLNRLSIFTINLTANLEPVYGIILAAILLKDYQFLSPLFYVAVAIIVSTLFMYPVMNRKFG